MQVGRLDRGSPTSCPLRARAASDDVARRVDRVRVASLYSDALGRPADAIAAWRQIEELFGPAGGRAALPRGALPADARLEGARGAPRALGLADGGRGACAQTSCASSATCTVRSWAPPPRPSPSTAARSRPIRTTKARARGSSRSPTTPSSARARWPRSSPRCEPRTTGVRSWISRPGASSRRRTTPRGSPCSGRPRRSSSTAQATRAWPSTPPGARW